MEKWIEEFRQEIKQLINKWESVNTEHTNGWAYGATRVISKFNSAWAKYENENRSVTASKPTPPAESLQEMAKRMCDSYGDGCDGCPIDDCSAYGRRCVVSTLSEITDEHYGAQIEVVRKWNAENPPKENLCAAVEAAHTECANEGVACMGCKHNPNAVDHYARAQEAPEPPKPVKTYREDFFEKFPDAPKTDSGYPHMDVEHVYSVLGAKRPEHERAQNLYDEWDKPLGYWEA